MKKHENHSIDERAKVILRDALPPEDWQVYDIQPDYGKDFPVELVEDGRQTGVTFTVQLKGQRSARPKGNGAVSFRLDTDHLTYFLSLRQPVFLVVIDVTRRVGYWLFVQQYARSELADDSWKALGRVTVNLPDSNVLTDLVALRRAVRDAVTYMADLYPSSVEAAVRADVAKMESLDPRFRVSLQVADEHKHYRLHAKEPVSGTFTFKGDPAEIARKAEDLFDRGLPVDVTPGEVVATGSPLIEHVVGRLRRMQASWTRPGTMTVTALDDSGQDAGSIPAIPCTFTGGRREFRAKAELPLELGTFAMTYDRDAPERTTYKLSLRFDRWWGLPMSKLPMFDELASTFGRPNPLRIDFVLPGNRCWSPMFDVGKDDIGRVRTWLDVLGRARRVCRLLRIDPPFPRDFCDQDVEDVDFFFDLLVNGERTEDGSNQVVTATTTPVEVARLLPTPDTRWTEAQFRGRANAEFDFLRQQVALNDLEVCLTEADGEASRLSLTERTSEAADKALVIRWCGTEKSKLTYRLPPPSQAI